MKLIECSYIDKQWIEDLIWCPSQLYRRIKCGEQVFTLYLRWRHHDPWVFRVAKGDMLNDKHFIYVATELFEKYNIFRRDSEYKIAEYEAQEVFYNELPSILGLKGSTVVLVWSKEIIENAKKLFEDFMERVEKLENVVIVDDRNHILPSVYGYGMPKSVFVEVVSWALGFVDRRLFLDFVARSWY